MTQTTVQEERKMSKAETQFNADINAVYAKANADHKAMAAQLAASGEGFRVTKIGAEVAAVIFRDLNKKNRDLSLSKIAQQRDAMQRGEWKLNHQGIAFYPDATLADGQHRMAATALSGLAEVPFVVSSDFDKDAIDTIDRSARRTAGEALEMMGVNDGKAKATIGKTVMEYTWEEQHAKRPTFTDQQIERWVLENDDLLAKAIAIGRKSTDNVSDPCLTQMEGACFAGLMLMGGWGEQATVSYIASIQQGVATYPESPTVILSKLYLRAKINARRTDRLTKKAKIALALKGAAYWLEEKSVARMSWNPAKEALPSHIKPLGV
jgi:hypothetical protein